jgi:hypothetical protein
VLFNKFNRHHNSNCCKNHANKHGIDYKDNYCECTNENVDRTRI